MNVKQNAIAFLQSLGFEDVRPIQGPTLRLIVRTALKTAKKHLKAKNMRFTMIDENSTKNSKVQRYYVIQDRRILGRLNVEAFSTYSIIELIDTSGGI